MKNLLNSGAYTQFANQPLVATCLATKPLVAKLKPLVAKAALLAFAFIVPLVAHQAQAQTNAATTFVTTALNGSEQLLTTGPSGGVGEGSQMVPFGNRAHIYRFSIGFRVTPSEPDTTFNDNNSNEPVIFFASGTSGPIRAARFTSDNFEITIRCRPTNDCTGFNNLRASARRNGNQVIVDITSWRAGTGNSGNNQVSAIGGVQITDVAGSGSYDVNNVFGTRSRTFFFSRSGTTNHQAAISAIDDSDVPTEFRNLEADPEQMTNAVALRVNHRPVDGSGMVVATDHDGTQDNTHDNLAHGYQFVVTFDSEPNTPDAATFTSGGNNTTRTLTGENYVVTIRCSPAANNCQGFDHLNASAERVGRTHVITVGGWRNDEGGFNVDGIGCVQLTTGATALNRGINDIGTEETTFFFSRRNVFGETAGGGSISNPNVPMGCGGLTQTVITYTHEIYTNTGGGAFGLQRAYATSDRTETSGGDAATRLMVSGADDGGGTSGNPISSENTHIGWRIAIRNPSAANFMRGNGAFIRDPGSNGVRPAGRSASTHMATAVSGGYEFGLTAFVVRCASCTAPFTVRLPEGDNAGGNLVAATGGYATNYIQVVTSTLQSPNDVIALTLSHPIDSRFVDINGQASHLRTIHYTAPTPLGVTGITGTASTTVSGQIDWIVTFSESVTGVNRSIFNVLDSSGNVVGDIISADGDSGTGTTINVSSVHTPADNGALRLMFEGNVANNRVSTTTTPARMVEDDFTTPMENAVMLNLAATTIVSMAHNAFASPFDSQPIANAGAGTQMMPYNNAANVSLRIDIKYSNTVAVPDSFTRTTPNSNIVYTSSEYVLTFRCLATCEGVDLTFNPQRSLNDVTVHQLVIRIANPSVNVAPFTGPAVFTLEERTGSGAMPVAAGAIAMQPEANRIFYINRAATGDGGEAITPPSLTSISFIANNRDFVEVEASRSGASGQPYANMANSYLITLSYDADVGRPTGGSGGTTNSASRRMGTNIWETPQYIIVIACEPPSGETECAGLDNIDVQLGGGFSTDSMNHFITVVGFVDTTGGPVTQNVSGAGLIQIFDGTMPIAAGEIAMQDNRKLFFNRDLTTESGGGTALTMGQVTLLECQAEALATGGDTSTCTSTTPPPPTTMPTTITTFSRATNDGSGGGVMLIDADGVGSTAENPISHSGTSTFGWRILIEGSLALNQGLNTGQQTMITATQSGGNWQVAGTYFQIVCTGCTQAFVLDHNGLADDSQTLNNLNLQIPVSSIAESAMPISFEISTPMAAQSELNINTRPANVRTLHFQPAGQDTTAPTATIEGRANNTAGTITWTITFNETVVNVATDQFSISGNGMLGDVSGSGTRYTITSTHTHLTDGDITLTFDADAGTGDTVADQAGNEVETANDATTTGMETIEVAPPGAPTATIRGVVSDNTIMWTITFDQAVMNVDENKFSITADGTAVTNILSMFEAADDMITYTIISSHTHLNDGRIILMFDADNGTAAVSVDDNTIEAANATGQATISIADPALLSVRTTRPNSQSQHEVLWTITFNTPVNSFTAMVANGASLTPSSAETNITTALASTDNIVWTLTSSTTPADQDTMGEIILTIGDVTTQTGSHMVTNIANQYTAFVGGLSASQLINLADESVGGFMNQSTQQILAAMPNIKTRLTRKSRAKSTTNRNLTADNDSMNINITNGTNTMNYASNQQGKNIDFKAVYALTNSSELTDYELWLDGTYIIGDSNDGRQSESFYLHMGTDFQYKQNIVLGVMLQIDESTLEDRGINTITNNPFTSEITVDGVMFGPYIVANLPKYDLDISGQFAQGKGEGTFKYQTAGTNLNDTFDVKRSLFTGSLSRDFDVSRTYILTPAITYSSFKDRQLAYTSRERQIRIPANEIKLKRLEASLEASKQMQIGGVEMLPSLTLTGIFDETETESTKTGRLETNLIFQLGTIDWHLKSHYDIISETQNLKTYGISTGINIKF